MQPTTPPTRPITPIRPSSRSSLRDSVSRGHGPYTHSDDPLQDLHEGFADLSDEMATLEDNFKRLHEIHESMARFSESFAAFLYGMNMNAFCVDFTEAPTRESFERYQNNSNPDFSSSFNRPEPDVDATFLTTDTSFVENPPTSSKPTPKFTIPPPQTPTGRTTMAAPRGRGIPRASAAGAGAGARGGIPTARRGGIPRAGSAIGRGRGRGRPRGAA